MNSIETVLAGAVVGLACFIGGQTIGTRDRTTTAEAAGVVAPRATREDVPDALRNDHTEEGPVAATLLVRPDRPSATPLQLRRRLANSMSGTYMQELLIARDSALARWPERQTRPLRVWIREAEDLDGWNPDFMSAIRDAFDTWVQVGVPVHFTFIGDSASADVHVRFAERFANGISGKTIWSRDAAWWLVSGDIQLGLEHPSGGHVSPPQMRAIALHEIGHLLGLDHTSEPEHIMSARIRVRDLSNADRATVRLLYAVPAGSLR